MEQIEEIVIKEGFPKRNYREMLKWFQDREVMRYIVFGETVSKFTQISDVGKFFVMSKDEKFFRIYLQEDKLIGYTCLYDIIPNKECSFGIVIGEKEHWGKGFGKKALIQTIDYAKKNLKIEKAALTVCDIHEKAKKVYEEMGFKTTKHVEDDRQISFGDEWVKAGTYHMELIL